MTAARSTATQPAQDRAATDRVPAGAERTIGDYLLERRLGSGAMGEVWLARHAVTGGRAAVKRLHPQVAARENVKRFFVRERRAIALLSHPHVVSLYDVGPDWIATQFVAGSNLAHRLQTPIDPATAIAYALQIASALDHAHAKGVVHRDVKPSNILIDGRGNAYLADFGLASFVDEESPQERAGTPSFMAPEQARGNAVPASDQYAFARTVLEMLAGASVPTDRDQAIAQLPPHLPRALGDVLRRATARAPEDRWPSMADLAAQLAAIDLRDFPAPFRLAPEVRVRAGFEWCTRPFKARSVSPDVMRADYRLSQLEAAGVFSREACDQFRALSGYDELVWSAYAHKRRLGPIVETSVLARAADLVVILHGMLCTRDDWHELALSACRDNAQAVVLVPDLFGCGESVMDGERMSREQASGPGIVRGVLAWLDLLGVRDLPTVLLGHSLTGAALLSVTDDELGERIARIAITPIMPLRGAMGKKLLTVYASMLRAGAGVTVLKRLIAMGMRGAPSSKAVTLEQVQEFETEFMRATPAVLARLTEGFAITDIAPPPQHGRCTVLVGDDDPIATAEMVVNRLRGLGFPLEHVEHLIGVGHHPIFQSRIAPEITARNLCDIARVIDTMLSSSRDGSPLSTAVESTIIASSEAPAVSGARSAPGAMITPGSTLPGSTKPGSPRA